MRRVLACLIAVAATGGGCGDESVLNRSELVIRGDGWYHLDTELWVPGSAVCFSQTTKATRYTLEGVPLHQGDCGAFSDTLSASGPFVVDVHHGSETARVIVDDLFPGAAATINDPPSGQVAPGGRLLVEFPSELATFSFPYLARFQYTDTDDPRYTGETSSLTTVAPGLAELSAPEHVGHFTLQIDLSLLSTDAPIPARLVSCQGLARCTAHAAAALGPLAVEVTAP